MDVNAVFNDVYERVVAYYKNKKSMDKTEVGKRDNKFKEFWITRAVDNYFLTNIRVSVTQNEIIVHSLCSPAPEFRICIVAFKWLSYSDERKKWLLSYALEQHEKLLLEHYALVYSEVRQEAINSHKDISKSHIRAFFASNNVLSLVTDRNTSTGLNSIYEVYLDVKPKPVKMQVVFSEEDKDLVITTSTGRVSKVPKGTHLPEVLDRILHW